MRPDHQSPLFGLRIPRGGLHASRPAHAHGSIENEKKSVKNRNRQRVREAVSHAALGALHPHGGGPTSRIETTASAPARSLKAGEKAMHGDYPPKQINFLLRSNGEAWAVATAPQPDRYKRIDVINKRRVLLRATVGTYSAQTPPPSELRVSGGASLTA